MGLVVCLFSGVFIGWLKAAIEEVDAGILSRMAIGLLGGTIGGLTATMVDSRAAMGQPSIVSIGSACIGAIILLGLSHYFVNYKSTNTNTAQ